MKIRLRMLGNRLIYAIRIKRLLLFLFIVLFCITNIAVTAAVQKTVLPIIKSQAEIIAKREATMQIYDAVQNVLDSEDLTYSNLYTIVRVPDGTISSIEINTTAVNSLKAKITQSVINNINNTDSKKLSVPLGNVFNHLIFSGRGPKIPVHLTCYGFTSADFLSTFSSAGINQTKHSVSLDVKTEVEIVLPYDILSVSVKTEVPVTETVIVGNVPNLYTLSSEH